MATTRDVERLTRTAREMTEAQRDSYEALVENFAALQRRNVGFAQDGIEFLRLQESNARAAQEWLANGAKLVQLQQRNIRFAQRWLTGGIELLRDQTEHNLRTAEVFAQSARKQQEGLRELTEEWTEAYQDFFFSPFTYAREGLRTTQQVAQQGLQVTQQVAQQGLRLAEEAAEQTEEAIRQTELQAAVRSALKTEDYNELSVSEVSSKLADLTVEDLKKVREYEKQNKNRESLVERIDRKIRANS